MITVGNEISRAATNFLTVMVIEAVADEFDVLLIVAVVSPSFNPNTVKPTTSAIDVSAISML